MSLALAALVDVTIVLGLALGISVALRQRSASLRHAVLGAGLLAAAAAPALEMFVPAWEVPIAWGAPAEASSTLTLTSRAVTDDVVAWTPVPAPEVVSWVEAIRIAWMAGALVVLAGLITSLVRLSRETRRCAVIRSGPWRDLADRLSPRPVTLLESHDPALLLTWGFFRPKILLPFGAESWSAERRAVVLAHELAHIRRGDWALQLAGAVAAAIVAAAPIAAIAITEPAERSVMSVADADVVLAAPVPVDTSAPVTPPPVAPAPRRARVAEPAFPARAFAKAPAGRQQAPAAISGVMTDASGAVLPAVGLTLTETPSGVVYSRVSDGKGSFEFPDLPPGRYALVAQLGGFATLKIELTLAAGENLQRRLSMRIGGIVETITVRCETVGGSLPAIARGVMARARPEAAPLFTMPQAVLAPQDRPATPGQPVCVGGNIRAPQRVKEALPVCPTASLPASGAVVILEATIGPDGRARDVRVLRSVPPFDQPAVDAVRQWEFTPALLNNVAVPVIMTVTVLYQGG